MTIDFNGQYLLGLGKVPFIVARINGDLKRTVFGQTVQVSNSRLTQIRVQGRGVLRDTSCQCLHTLQRTSSILTVAVQCTECTYIDVRVLVDVGIASVVVCIRKVRIDSFFVDRGNGM